MLPNFQCEFSDNRLSDCQQEFSNICLPDQKQRLAIKEAKILAIKMTLSNADDIMLTSSSQRQGDTCHVQYSAY
jgi:hypothetical protein